MFFSYKSLIPLLGSLFASVQISLFAESNFMDHIVFKSLHRIKTNTNFRTWAGSDSFPLGKCCFIESYKLLKKKKKKNLQRGKKRLLQVESSEFQFLTLKVELAAAHRGMKMSKPTRRDVALSTENQSMFVMDLRLALDVLCPGETTELSFSMDQLDTHLIFTESCQDRRDRGA